MWAKEGHYDCNFLCICVLGDDEALSLAKEFSHQMQLSHCINGYVNKEEDLPTWGQLGCKGFIVLDENHRVVAPTTPAFMQVRGLAFAHVEALLDAVCNKRPLPSILPAEYAVLSQPPDELAKLKGCQGMIIEVKGDLVHFGFMQGPYRGKAMELPASAVSALQPRAGGGCDGGGCSSGGCSDGNCGPKACTPGAGDCSEGGCDGTGTCLDEAFVNSSLDLVSVKVPSMDEEHADCAVALRDLATRRNADALEAVWQCLSDHFEHEERLFVEYGFGAHVNENLSARKSHMEDHRRILDKIRSVLDTASGPTAAVSAGFVRALLQDFHDHTSRYDVSYAEHLSAKGAR